MKDPRNVSIGTCGLRLGMYDRCESDIRRHIYANESRTLGSFSPIVPPEGYNWLIYTGLCHKCSGRRDSTADNNGTAVQLWRPYRAPMRTYARHPHILSRSSLTTPHSRSAILFDGSLPASKKDERSSRLQQNVKRVTQLRSMHSTTGCPIPTKLGSVLYPFLAPALMEALHATSFSRLTRMVPGEADDWCAASARDHPRSIIFTVDTDLLLYDYHPETLVIFFKDVDIFPGSDIKVFSPTKISQQLKLTSLIHLAYTIHLRRWGSTTEHIREAHKLDLSSSQYLEFRKRYTDRPQNPPYISSYPDSNDLVQALDTRVSEYVHQTLSVTDKSSNNGPLAFSVFLPLLVEDPFQASAWKFGTDCRLLAYSLLSPARVVIQEHLRKAQGISIQELAPLAPMQQVTQATELLQAVTAFFADHQLSKAHKWPLLGLRLALQDLKPPHISLAARVIAGDFDNTWAFVHLHACMQAVLYSLRILGQCITIWLTINRGHLPTMAQQLFTSLNQQLRSLPTIANLFTIPGQATKVVLDDLRLLEAIKAVYTMAGITDQRLFEEPKSKRQRKRDKRRDKRDKTTRAELLVDTQQQLKSNKFTILKQEV